MPWTNVLCQLFKIQSYGVGVLNALLSLDCILADKVINRLYKSEFNFSRTSQQAL